MSVNRSGGMGVTPGPDTWYNLEHQHVDGTVSVSGGELSGGNESSSAPSSSETRLSPAGGLQRGEVAELVALIATHAIGWQLDTDGANAAEGEAFQIRMKPELAIPGVDSSFDQVASGVDDGNGDFPVIKRLTENNEGFRLYTRDMIMNPTYRNGTDASGGGGGETSYLDVKSYRDLFGRGPILDHNDEVAFNEFVEVTNTEDVDLVHQFQYEFVWDLFEVDDPIADLKNDLRSG